MVLRSDIIEGRNAPVYFHLPMQWGGGKVKIEILIENGFLQKFSFAYINIDLCRKGRMFGVDSFHPGHPSDCPHVHYCEQPSRDMPKTVSPSQALKFFITGLSKIIMKKVTKNNPLNLSETEQEELRNLPELNDFVESIIPTIQAADLAFERNLEYYRLNPDAAPINSKTPPLK